MAKSAQRPKGERNYAGAKLVVALAIPLVLGMTFAAMLYFHIGLHKISLGALVLALGLLVDDAIIAVEMMAVKMEQGFDRLAAASFAYTSTAFPMLTGTLVTAAGFLPIATAQSGTGEYTRSRLGKPCFWAIRDRMRNTLRRLPIIPM